MIEPFSITKIDNSDLKDKIQSVVIKEVSNDVKLLFEEIAMDKNLANVKDVAPLIKELNFRFIFDDDDNVSLKSNVKTIDKQKISIFGSCGL